MTDVTPPSPPATEPAAEPAATPATAQANTRPSRLRRWGRRLLYATAGLLGLWALTWLGLPPLLKWQGQKIASAQLGRAVHIGHIDFKPWTLELTVSDVQMAGAQPGDAPQFSLQRLYIDAELQSLLRLAPVLDTLQIDQPTLRLTHLGEGRYDIDDIRQRLAERPQPPAEEEGEGARFALYNIALQGGLLEFDDRPAGQVHRVQDLQLSLPFISNLPSQRQVRVQPHLAWRLGDSHFDSQAQALPFDASRHTDAVLRFTQLNLGPYLAYLPADLPLRPTQGVLDAELRLRFDQQNDQPALQVQGQLALHRVQALDAQQQTALAFDQLALTVQPSQPLQRQLHLSEVQLHAPRLHLQRDQDGQLSLLPPAAEKATSETPAEAPAAEASQASAPARDETPASPNANDDNPWQIRIDHIALNGGDIDWHDHAAAPGQPPAQLQLQDLHIQLHALHWPMNEPLRFAGAATLATEAKTEANAETKVETKAETPTTARAETQAEPAAANAAASAPQLAAAEAPASAASAAEAAPEATADAAPTLPALPPLPGSGAALAFSGLASPRDAQVQLQARALPLPLAAPYLRPHLKPALGGQLDTALTLHWAAAAQPGQDASVHIHAERLNLSQLALTGEGVAAPALTPADRRAPRTNRTRQRANTATATAEAPEAAATARENTDRHPATARDRARRGPLIGIDQLNLGDVRLALPEQRLTIGQIDIHTPRLAVLRHADGRWMAQDWLPPAEAKTSGKPSPAAATAKPWQVQVQALNLQGGALDWRDATPAQPVRADVRQISLQVREFELGSGKPLPLELSALIGTYRGPEPGRLSWRGQVGTEPLNVQGELDAQRLPAHIFMPYAGPHLPVDVLRADASFKGQVHVAQTKADSAPSLRISGNASVHELRTHSLPGDDGATAAAAQASASASAPEAAASSPTATAEATASHAPLAPDAAAARRGNGLGEELLSIKHLQLDGLDVQHQPGHPLRVDIKETLLADFFARLTLLPDGTFSLTRLTGAPPPDTADTAASAAEANAESPLAAQPAADTASTAVAAASAPAAAAAPDPNAPVIHIGPVQVRGGHIAFADYFIRPNYSADLTELNGSLGAFSTAHTGSAPQMAALNLTGRAEGTAALEISGQLNPLAKPLALDINGKVRDLELPPLSPYTIKYAGHGIERGKLSVDVHYAIQPDGQLTASNKIVLKQLSFGDPVPDAPASLPVRLATALLADSQGVIDLDLPIKGSLNDPQFSLGPVIFKAVMNLIGKAITAPFRLLASAFGGGDDGGADLSHVHFADGSAQLPPAAQEQLAAVAKALADRPQLKLTVIGHAGLQAEAEGYRRQRLQAMIAAEQRATATASAQPAASAPEAAASEAEGAEQPEGAASAETALQADDPQYAELLRRLYRRADLPGKPRNALGLARDVPVEQMQALLMQHIPVTEDAMRQLALQRSVAVRDHLSAQGLPSDRLFLGSPRTHTGPATPAANPASAPEGEDKPDPNAWQPGVELNLESQ